ncbi:hypothetical protein EGW08_002331 [Elysia chlorotica]|uniref:Tetraspanin n=1 Tax=Elysia chlorotica TaxID=188477 RepID=A0A3S1A3R6_ELYCH|nr:hypothetical protein EGW08_002331 [Elysia chlorotica]
MDGSGESLRVAGGWGLSVPSGLVPHDLCRRDNHHRLCGWATGRHQRKEEVALGLPWTFSVLLLCFDDIGNSRGCLQRRGGECDGGKHAVISHQKYGQDSDVTNAWDQLQSELGCCAISETTLGDSYLFNFPYVDETSPQSSGERDRQDSWPIYKRTEFFRRQLAINVNERKYVPESCCKYDSNIRDYANLRSCQYFSTGPPSNYEMKLKNDYLHYDGCYSKARSLMLNQSDIIVAMGFVFGLIMIVGMVLTFFVIKALRAEAEEKMKERRRPENRDASLDLL